MGGKQEDRAWRVIRLHSEQLCLVYRAILTEKHSRWDSICGIGPGYNTIQIHPNTQEQGSNLFILSMYINASCLESFRQGSAFISTTKHRSSTEHPACVLSCRFSAILHKHVKCMQCHRAGWKGILKGSSWSLKEVIFLSQTQKTSFDVKTIYVSVLYRQSAFNKTPSCQQLIMPSHNFGKFSEWNLWLNNVLMLLSKV